MYAVHACLLSVSAKRAAIILQEAPVNMVMLIYNLSNDYMTLSQAICIGLTPRVAGIYRQVSLPKPWPRRASMQAHAGSAKQAPR